MKRVLSIAALVLAGGALSACGGGVDAPTNASEEDFCGAASPENWLEYFDEEAEEFNAADLADNLEEVGTPEGISDDAREGFEVYVTEFRDAGNGLSESDFEDLEDDTISDDDKEKADAFDEYVSETCA